MLKRGVRIGHVLTIGGALLAGSAILIAQKPQQSPPPAPPAGQQPASSGQQQQGQTPAPGPTPTPPQPPAPSPTQPAEGEAFAGVTNQEFLDALTKSGLIDKNPPSKDDYDSLSEDDEDDLDMFTLREEMIKEEERKEAEKKKEEEKKQEDAKKTPPKKGADKGKTPAAQSLDVAPKDAGKNDPKPQPPKKDDVPAGIRDEVGGPFVPDAEQPRAHRPVTIFVIGRSGDVEARVYSDHVLTDAERREVVGRRGVIVPASDTVRAAAQSVIDTPSLMKPGVHVLTVQMRSYCLEAVKPAAIRGALYTWAPRAAQAQFEGVRPVRAVAEFAARSGYLRPQGDTAAYGESIAQYAIWTRVEHWDRSRFTTEFIRRTRDEMRADHQAWSDETERTLGALAPGRWNDVARVLSMADRVETRAR